MKRFVPILLFVGLIIVGLIGCCYYILRADRDCPVHAGSAPDLNVQRQKDNPNARANYDIPSDKHQTSSAVLPVFHALENVQTYNAERTGDAENGQAEHPRWLTKFLCEAKLADVALVFFTYALVLVTGWLVWATLKLWNVTERSLTELEAPLIGIEIVDPGLECNWSDGEDTYIINKTFNGLTFRFVNFGKTGAALLGLEDKLEICDSGTLPRLEWNPERSKIYPYGVLVGADRPSSKSFRSWDKFFDKQKFMMFQWGESDLFVVGRLRYRDIFYNVFELGFCTVFNRETGGFMMTGGDRYNYCRRVH